MLPQSRLLLVLAAMSRLGDDRPTRRIRIRLLTNPKLVDRQREYKPASLRDLALYPYPSPMQFDKLLGQG
jgi:hypothetical protein